MNMKTKLWGAGAVAAILFLSGGRYSLIANAQDQPLPPAGNSAPENSTALPPDIYPSSPLAQVIKLTQAGVSEAVIMAYVTNSGSTFNLDPDKIIYLKDIGAPDDLVTAMMQRDQVLQAEMAAAAYQPPPQPTPATEPVATGSPPAEMPVDQPAPVTVNYFYDSLAPYGIWVDVEGYGRCWQPTAVVAEPGWQPYCDRGHWVFTDCGWYWMSDYSWGWATFHYGRWFYHARFGWCWMPDTVWGPSWVTWRYSTDYCGWAPLPPFTSFVSGIGFTYRGAAVSVGFDFGLGASTFVFVPTRNFCDPRPRLYRAEPREATLIYSHTTVINNFNVDSRSRTVVNGGIGPERITAVTRTEIHPVAIHEATAPIARGEQLGRDGRTLMVNRPNFAANPQPSDRGAVPHAAPPSPMVANPPQPLNNGNESYNSPPRRYQPAPAIPTPDNRYAPVPPVRSLPPNYTPVAPAPPSAPNDNLNNSTDNRRYPSPHMQQTEQQSPRPNPGNAGGREAAPAQPPPGESRASYSQPPAADNPSRSEPAPSSPPAPSQRSGGYRNQNGQQ